ncbi:MAG: GNAT family N-acetyltransferase [Myxococcaceae bacterium]|nr:GNAT family N-acetyltransferase [Myxococcaceae bacterium]
MTCATSDWRQRYADKVMTAEQAVKRLQPGRRILIGSGAAEPISLVRAMVESAPQLTDNDVVHLLTLGPAPYVAPSEAARFRHCAFFIGANVREAVWQGRADFMPVFLSEIPELIRSRRVRVDAALIQVSPPDEHGFVSLGVSVDIVRAAVDSAAVVLAEVNPNMPRTFGDAFIDVRRLDALVPVDTPLLELNAEAGDDVSREIGRLVATLVPDGATLQLGIGRIPDAVLAALEGHHDLGIHTEMLSDGVMRLFDAQVITGRKKTLLPGKMVTSFLMGSSALYRWAHRHPALEMRASDFTNDPAVIARNHAMIAINSALAVDLTGQVAADTVGGRFFSGIGGQVDFIRGAARSPAGKPIIALPSMAKKGTVSRIQAAFDAGAGVVTSRGDVHCVVTEYGIADLWGKSVRERALALISVAHPDARGELLNAAKARHYVFVDQPVPQGRYLWAEERHVTTRDGASLLVRPARVTDEAGLQHLLYSCSNDTLYQRFLGHRRTHLREEIQSLADLSDERNMALVVCPAGSEELVAIARYDVDPGTGLADLAFLVRDDWQHRGVGTALMRRMLELAYARGLPGFALTVLEWNAPMLSLIRESGLNLESHSRDGVYQFIARFP